MGMLVELFLDDCPGAVATIKPRSRLGRLVGFARRLMTTTLNTIGMAHEAIHRSVFTYHTVRDARRRHREQILTALKILATAAAMLGGSVAVYFIIVNIVVILTAIELERHDQFLRRGADLHTELPIHRADAVRCTVVSLGTLRGRVDVPLRPEFLDGETFRARGEGLPFRHDPERRGYLRVSFTLLPTPDRPVSVTPEEVDRGCSRKLSDLGIVAQTPPGVATGSRVYVAASHGRETNLLINVLPHRKISRRDDDLYLTAAVTHAALLLRSNHCLDVLDRRLDVRRLRNIPMGGKSAWPARGCPICVTPNGGATSTSRSRLRMKNAAPANQDPEWAGWPGLREDQ